MIIQLILLFHTIYKKKKILSITLTNELRIIIKLTRVAVGNIERPNAIIYYSAIKVRNFTVIESNIF